MAQETVNYPCGCSATGSGNIPKYCPDHGESRCRYCGENIRLIDGEWMDSETGHTCGRLDRELPQDDDDLLVAAITAIVRGADRSFEKSGGSSRHWVRDEFLPALNAAGWRLTQPSYPLPHHEPGDATQQGDVQDHPCHADAQ